MKLLARISNTKGLEEKIIKKMYKIFEKKRPKGPLAWLGREKGRERPGRRVVWIGSGPSEIRSAQRKSLAEKFKGRNVVFFFFDIRRNVLDFSNKKHACYDRREKQQEKFEDD